ncbi:probable cytochrome P450 12a4, mitochondrial [Zophobas morio]
MSTNVENTSLEKKREYYRNLNALDTTDAKPRGWDKAKPFESIPGARCFPVIGNLWRLWMPLFRGKDIVAVHKELCAEYGNILTLKGILGSGFKQLVVLYDPKDFETVVKNEGVWPIRKGQPSLEYYRKLRKDSCPNFGFATLQGEDWFTLRTTANPILLQPKIINEYTEKVDRVTTELVDNMKYLAERDEAIKTSSDFKNEMDKWALESIGVVALDTHLGCLKRNLELESEAQKMINSSKQIFELMYKLDVLPSMWKLMNTPTWNKYVEVIDFLIQTSAKHVNRALDNFDKETDTTKEAGSVLHQIAKKDRNIALSTALDMMLVGVDTTGRILSAGLYFLAKNREQQIRLREEAKRLLKNKNTPVTTKVLAEATYLKAVVKEVTRLAPIGVGNLRTTVKNLTLAGYQVPKGTDIMTANLIPCTTDEYFPRAKEFLPERWLSSHKTANPFAFAPFGLGSRSCLGKRLANLELHIAFLKIIRNFDLSWPHEDMCFTTTIFYGIGKPLQLHIKALNQ